MHGFFALCHADGRFFRRPRRNAGGLDEPGDIADAVDRGAVGLVRRLAVGDEIVVFFQCVLQDLFFQLRIAYGERCGAEERVHILGQFLFHVVSPNNASMIVFVLRHCARISSYARQPACVMR